MRKIVRRCDTLHPWTIQIDMLKEKLAEDLKAAMKSKDAVRLRTIRSLRAAMMEKEISERHDGEATLTEQQELSVVQKQAKQRRDSIEQFSSAGRQDLAEIEEAELEIIESYLPKQLSEDEIREIVVALIEESGASGMKDMGKIMGPAMQRVAGRADGKSVQALVRSLLS
jgi:uncharacterized protein YqeY